MRKLLIITVAALAACAEAPKADKRTSFAGTQGGDAAAVSGTQERDGDDPAEGDEGDDETASASEREGGSTATGTDTAPQTSDDGTVSKPTKGGGAAPAGADAAADDDDGSGDDSSGDDGTAGGGSEQAGARYFEDTIFPLFTAQCVTCHADPRMNPPQRGPLTIFSYENMRQLLASGPSASDNGLSRKIRNVDPHGGGNRCSAGPTGTPCKQVLEWWRLELGADSGLDGRVTSVSESGDVFGYAVDTRDEALKVTARLFVDGKVSIETPASVAGADSNYAGDHAFKVQLPVAARDGKEHTLQLHIGDVPVGAAVKFIAYAPKDAGKAYFQSTVAPALNGRCGGCHVVQYEVQYGALISPAPSKGGTALANTLIDYAAGANGHPGGNVCGGKSGSPCNLFQTWWSMEFGP